MSGIIAIDGSEVAPLRSPPRRPDPIVSDARILVVDDEPDIIALVAYHLAKDGLSRVDGGHRAPRRSTPRVGAAGRSWCST